MFPGNKPSNLVRFIFHCLFWTLFFFSDALRPGVRGRRPRLFIGYVFFPFPLHKSPNAQVQTALSIASREEAPFGSLVLCREGFGESRASSMADDYLSLGAVDFAR